MFERADNVSDKKRKGEFSAKLVKLGKEESERAERTESKDGVGRKLKHIG